jgi:hypothetical protein
MAHGDKQARIIKMLDDDARLASVSSVVLAELAGCSANTVHFTRKKWLEACSKPDTSEPEKRCSLCNGIESEDDPLGRSGQCVMCWWTVTKGWSYYAFRTGSVTREQLDALNEEFGEVR